MSSRRDPPPRRTVARPVFGTMATVLVDNSGGTDMTLQIGAEAPDFEADSTEGPLQFHEWLRDAWAVLFPPPKSFTPVCTTELGYMASIEPEFEKRGVKIAAISVDPVDANLEWSKAIREPQ